MSSTSTNLGLNLTTAADGSTRFQDWRLSIDGDVSTSNMRIIDAAVGTKLATLDENGHVPMSQVPGATKDVLEFLTLEDFPTTGESEKIYIATETNITYRWNETNYVAIGSDLALGETGTTAYRGDRGKIAYEHSQTSSVHVTPDEKSKWNEKQDSLIFDSEPAEGSANPVTSEGIKVGLDAKAPISHVHLKNQITDFPTNISEFDNDTGYLTQHQDISGKADKQIPSTPGNLATLDGNGNITDGESTIANLQPKLTFDASPTKNSLNPVTSDGIKTALDGVVPGNIVICDFDASDEESYIPINADKLGGHPASYFAAADDIGQIPDGSLTMAKMAPEVTAEMNGKADKALSAVSGNLAALDASGNLEDSGKSVATSIANSSSQIPTSSAIVAILGRTTAVTAADANYTAYMARGEALAPADATPAQNGQICWTYG